MGLLLLAKQGLGYDLAWTPAHPNVMPAKSTMVFTEDFSTKFVGTYISQKSWTKGRKAPTIETCAVACATKCTTKRATKCTKNPVADTSSCNAFMYVRATGECHMGRGISLLTSTEEPTEFVYMVPGSGSWQSVYTHPTGTEHQIIKGSLLATLPTLKKQWRVTFQLKATKQDTLFRNVLHLTIGDFKGNHGDRTLYFSIFGKKIIIKSSLNGNPNGGPSHVFQTVALNTWETVENCLKINSCSGY